MFTRVITVLTYAAGHHQDSTNNETVFVAENSLKNGKGCHEGRKDQNGISSPKSVSIYPCENRSKPLANYSGRSHQRAEPLSRADGVEVWDSRLPRFPLSKLFVLIKEKELTDLNNMFFLRFLFLQKKGKVFSLEGAGRGSKLFIILLNTKKDLFQT